MPDGQHRTARSAPPAAASAAQHLGLFPFADSAVLRLGHAEEMMEIADREVCGAVISC